MSKKKKSGTDVEKLMNDDRFKDMFEDEEFARDVNSDAYKLNNPVSKTILNHSCLPIRAFSL